MAFGRVDERPTGFTLAYGLLGYQNAKRKFPAHFSPGGPTARTGAGWHCHVLPFIEQAAVHAGLDLKGSAYPGGQNQALGANRLLCPSYAVDRLGSTVDAAGGQNAFTTHFYGNAGPVGTNPQTQSAYATLPASQGAMACDGVLPFSPVVVAANPTRAATVRIKDITDGTSKTLMHFEIAWKGLEESPATYRSWVRGICRNNESSSFKNVQNAMNTVRYNAGTKLQRCEYGKQS